jgi:hypothetical protein
MSCHVRLVEGSGLSRERERERDRSEKYAGPDDGSPALTKGKIRSYISQYQIPHNVPLPAINACREDRKKYSIGRKEGKEERKKERKKERSEGQESLGLRA